jgi:hypothetical protein
MGKIPIWKHISTVVERKKDHQKKKKEGDVFFVIDFKTP